MRLIRSGRHGRRMARGGRRGGTRCPLEQYALQPVSWQVHSGSGVRRFREWPSRDAVRNYKCFGGFKELYMLITQLLSSSEPEVAMPFTSCIWISCFQGSSSQDPRLCLLLETYSFFKMYTILAFGCWGKCQSCRHVCSRQPSPRVTLKALRGRLK